MISEQGPLRIAYRYVERGLEFLNDQTFYYRTINIFILPNSLGFQIPCIYLGVTSDHP